MSVRISKGRKGTTIRARGRDAQALFDALCRSAKEPTRPVVDYVEANREALAFVRDGITTKPAAPSAPQGSVQKERK